MNVVVKDRRCQVQRRSFYVNEYGTWSVNQALFFQVIRDAGKCRADESSFLAIFAFADGEVCIFEGG